MRIGEERFECSVCHIKDFKTGKHYGAITCYSCRAFFRRAQERKRPPKCKFNSACPVDQSVKKQCPRCRYQKCLGVGMQPELVLGEEERKERFRVSINRKHHVDQSPYLLEEENNVQQTSSPSGSALQNDTSVSPTVSPPYLQSSPRPIRIFPMPTHARSLGQNPIQTYGTPVPISFSPIFPTFSQQNIHQEGILRSPISYSSQSSAVKAEVIEEPQENTANDSINYDEQMYIENIQNTASTSRISVIKASEKNDFDYKIDTKYADQSNKVFVESKVDMDYLDEIQVDQSKDSKMIMKYIHKKFGNGYHDRNSLKRDVKVHNTENLNGYHISENRKRKSVIVRNHTSKVARKEVYLEDNTSLESVDDGQGIQELQLAVMNPLVTNALIEQENNYMNILQDKFEITWNEISLGEEIVADYINFCQNINEFKFENWVVSNRQFRERFLNFFCSLDMIGDIPTKTLFNLFKTNLNTTQMLTYVFVFNAPSWVEELDFVYGSNDKKQWKARDPSIAGVPLNRMLQYIPLSEELKLDVYKYMYHSCAPIFKDRTVFILLSIIVICGNESHPAVTKIRQNIASMLTRYLEKQSKGKDYANFEMQNIAKCIENLPRLAQIFSD